MERILTRRDVGGNIRGITALIYHPARKEIVAGFEDGAVKSWDFDSDKTVFSCTDVHKGSVTCFLYWSRWRALISASLDYQIVCWSAQLAPLQAIQTSGPIHSILWCNRRNELIAGTSQNISVFGLSGKVHNSGMPLLSNQWVTIPGHTDIVKCLTTDDTRIYSAGYDGMLIFYDISLSSFSMKSLPMKKHYMVKAHDAGVSCMVLAREHDAGSWLATGSFDQKVKVWSCDGKLLMDIQCGEKVTGVTFVPDTRILWVAAGTTTPTLYEPKTGDNISDYNKILHEEDHCAGCARKVLQLQYEPETRQVLGTTNQKECCVWKYSTSNSICTQYCDTLVDTLTYTNKIPILIFTGHADGSVLKWERLQLNTFLYSKEQFTYKDKLMEALLQEKEELIGHTSGISNNPRQDALEQAFEKKIKSAFEVVNRSFTSSLFIESEDLLLMGSQDGRIFVWGFDMDAIRVLEEMQKSSGTLQSTISETTTTGSPEKNKPDKYAILLQLTREEEELEKWEGPNMEGEGHKTKEERKKEKRIGQEKGVGQKEKGAGQKEKGVGQKEKGAGQEEKEETPNGLDPVEQMNNFQESKESSVTNRVAGFTCRLALCKHTAAVTGLFQLQRKGCNHLLLSFGWDLLVCVWDLEHGTLVTSLDVTDAVCSNQTHDLADSVITDADVTPDGTAFGYSLSTYECHIWSILSDKCDMSLKGKLVGHKKEVTQICWHSFGKFWVTGSEDETIRLWSHDSLTQFDLVQAKGPVGVMMVDKVNGCIIATVRDIIQIYNEQLHLLQCNRGHDDIIKSIIHIPELNQYITASYDKTIKIWKSMYHRSSQALENQEVDDEKEDTKEEKREDKTAHDQNESKDSTACVEE